MAGAKDEQIAEQLFDIHKRFSKRARKQLPGATPGNLWIFGVFFVGHCAAECAVPVKATEAYIDAVVGALKQFGGKNVREVMENTVAMLTARAGARKFECDIAEESWPEVLYEGFASDLLELSAESEADEQRIAEMSDFLQAENLAMQTLIRAAL